VPSLALPTAGDFELKIRITSDDLSTVTEYVFSIHRQSNAARLAQLSSSQADFTQSFQLGQLSYTLNLPSSDTSLLLSATPTHALATLQVAIGVAGAYVLLAQSTSVAVIPADQLDFGDTNVRVRVTAEDGTVGEVTELLVHRLSSDATLSGFVNTVEPVTITGGATAYTLHTSAQIATFNAQPVPASPYATLSFMDDMDEHETAISSGATLASLPLRLGSNVLKVIVRSEDGTVTRTYTFTVYRASGDGTLNSLTVASTGGVAVLLEPGFQSGLISYRATVGSTIASLMATAATHCIESSVSQADGPAPAA
jgi:hypothetical protein